MLDSHCRLPLAEKRKVKGFTQLMLARKIDPFGAKTVARYMRAACAVGAASFSDLVELLEFRNVRLHSLAMPAGVSSRAYFNVDNLSLISVRLRQKIREELRQYYKAHPKAMEPEPCLPPLRIGLREGLLAMEVGRKELKG